MEELKNTWKNRGFQNTLKFGLIAILAIFLLIPKFMILDLIHERQQQSESVTDQVAADWSASQTIQGPILVIPYKHTIVVPSTSKATASVEVQNLVVYPKSLTINGNLETTKKYRSIYEVLLYRSDLTIKGNFVIPSLEELNLTSDQILLSESYLVLGINDLKGIENKVDLSWNSTVLKLKPGTRDISFNQNPFLNPTHDASPIIHESYTGKSGLNTKVNIPNLNDEFSFSMNLNIKGSKQLLFTPFGEDTEVSLSSKYADPIFTGHFLPTHNTHSAGFDAQWKILEYNKILPSYQKGDDFVNAGKNVFGVEIKNLVDHYTKINRAAKYMFLVVALVFLVVFITELINDQKIHVFQYALVGFAIALFFVLLLSLSEFIGFDNSYVIASFAIISLITAYTRSIFKNKKSVYALLGLLVFMLSYIYLIIQLEKSALLVGSIGLFLILAATMYVTRKIKWYEEA